MKLDEVLLPSQYVVQRQSSLWSSIGSTNCQVSIWRQPLSAEVLKTQGVKASPFYRPLPALMGHPSPLLLQGKLLPLTHYSHLNPNSCACLSKRPKFTKDHLDFQWPLRGTRDLHKIVHLRDTLENKRKKEDILISMQRSPKEILI